MADLKFRISLTAHEISTICAYLPKGEVRLIKKLRVAAYKASEIIIAPSHVAVGKKDVDVSLGFTEDSTPADLYDLWNRGIKLSQSQLEIVETYRWTSGLMSPEEEEAYVSKLHQSPT